MIGKSSDIVIHPSDEFLETLDKSGIPMELVIDDIQK